MTNDQGKRTLKIRQYMDYGLQVYDLQGKKVGTVDQYDSSSGYMTVLPNAFSRDMLYVPFNAITHIDPREAFVSKTRDDLRRENSSPPRRHTVVEVRVDPDTGEDDSVAITSQPNGYDGSSVVVDEAAIGELAHHIAPGFHVYTSELKVIGTVKEFDRETGQILIDTGLLAKHDFSIPLAVVDLVDRENRTLGLAVSSADLDRLNVDV